MEESKREKTEKELIEKANNLSVSLDELYSSDGFLNERELRNRIIDAEERLKTEIPHLAPEFHKARRQLMLWSGILFVWEFIGINLDKVSESTGNVGVVVKSLKSPQAVPWVIIILIAYFLYRISIEWWQSSEERRRMRVSKVDFRSCWVVAFGAYSLYFIQSLSELQFANLLSDRGNRIGLLIGCGIGLCVTAVAFMSYKTFYKQSHVTSVRKKIYIYNTVGMVIAVAFFLVLSFYLKGTYDPQMLVLGLLIGSALVIPLAIAGFVMKYLNKTRQSD